MERFEFDSKTGPNNNRKNGFTRRGAIEVWPMHGGLLSESERLCVGIQGPAGADRGAVVIDKATAGKLGAALLKWAGEQTQENPEEFCDDCQAPRGRGEYSTLSNHGMAKLCRYCHKKRHEAGT